jgi:hypothetical protein
MHGYHVLSAMDLHRLIQIIRIYGWQARRKELARLSVSLHTKIQKKVTKNHGFSQSMQKSSNEYLRGPNKNKGPPPPPPPKKKPTPQNSVCELPKKMVLRDTSWQIIFQYVRTSNAETWPVIFGTVLELVLAMFRFFQSISQGQRHQNQNLLSRSLCCLKYKASSHLRDKFRCYISL